MGRSLKALLDIAFGNCHVMEYLTQTKGSFSTELGHNSILSLITFSGIVDINKKNIKRLSVRRVQSYWWNLCECRRKCILSSVLVPLAKASDFGGELWK